MAGKKGMKKSQKTLDRNKTEFLEKCIKVHGDKYDYSEADYVSSREKVKIRCVKHDMYFWQLPSAHVQGQNCPECGKEGNSKNSRLTDKEYKKRFIEANRNLNVSYVEGSFTQLHDYCEFFCELHGSLSKSANNSLLQPDSVCQECNKERMRIERQEKFVKKALLLHNFQFDYSKVHYTKNNEVVTLQCPIHGDFETTPNKHLDGRVGCYECARLKWGRWSPKVLKKNLDYFLNEECCLYLLKIDIPDHRVFYKVGITTSPDTRLQMMAKESGGTLDKLKIVWSNTYNCSELEHAFADKFKSNRFSHEVKFGGYTECYNFSEHELQEVFEFFAQAASE
jgi:Zn finger protein HypA/HybF involved in hydrogenase expression